MPEPIRVVLVDDHPMFVEGMRLLLDSDPEMEVVAEGHSGHEAVELTQKHSPDVLVIDMDLPDFNGVEAIRQIVAAGADTRIVVLSAFFDVPLVAEAFEMGAISFVPKTEAPEAMVAAVKSAARGDATVAEAHLGPLLKGMRDLQKQRTEASSVHERLSPREREVLRLLAQGRSVSEAASQLHISVLTLRGHVRNILFKLEVHSMTQAVALAHRSGLVERWDDDQGPRRASR